MKYKACCFIGHRKIVVSAETIEKLKKIIEDLILNHNVRVFLLGSNSEFNSLCHSIVTQLREKYPYIQRIMYTRKGEYCVLESEREQIERSYFNVIGERASFEVMEGEVEHKTKYTAGIASYVERNRAMIDDSDICVIYYKEKYRPSVRTSSRRGLPYQPKSGTQLAYNYIKQKKKIFISIADYEM